jgi:hypothetical protein
MGLCGPETAQVLKNRNPDGPSRFRGFLESSNRGGIRFMGTRSNDAFLKKADAKNDSREFFCQKQFYTQF